MVAVSSRFPAATMTPTVETCAHLLATTNDTAPVGGPTSDVVAVRPSLREIN